MAAATTKVLVPIGTGSEEMEAVRAAAATAQHTAAIPAVCVLRHQLTLSACLHSGDCD
jgi:hypothetical protein